MHRVSYLLIGKVSFMGLNTSLNTAGYAANSNTSYNQQPMPFMNNPMFGGSLFGGLQPSTTDYSQDLRMPSFLQNTTQAPASQNVQTPQQAQIPQQAGQNQTNYPAPNNIPSGQASGMNYPAQMNNLPNQNLTLNPNYQQDLSQIQKEINQKVAQENPGIGISREGNLYQTSNTAKKACVFLGFATPLAAGAYSMFKGAKLSSAFGIKNLLVKCPLFALAGVAVGAIGDYLINNSRAKEADAYAAAQAQNLSAAAAGQSNLRLNA